MPTSRSEALISTRAAANRRYPQRKPVVQIHLHQPPLGLYVG